MGPVTDRISVRNVWGYDCMFFGIEFVPGKIPLMQENVLPGETGLGSRARPDRQSSAQRL